MWPIESADQIRHEVQYRFTVYRDETRRVGFEGALKDALGGYVGRDPLALSESLQTVPGCVREANRAVSGWHRGVP